LGELHFCWWSWGIKDNGVLESCLIVPVLVNGQS
jgi:hypothetical protein